MAYVIAEPCIGTKDTACVDACPVDCIHPKKDEPNFADRRDALHRPGGMHRLRRVRPGVPGIGHFRARRSAGEMERFHAQERRVLRALNSSVTSEVAAFFFQKQLLSGACAVVWQDLSGKMRLRSPDERQPPWKSQRSHARARPCLSPADTTLRASKIFFQVIPGLTGKGYVGKSGMVRATLAKVIRVLWPNSGGGFSDSFFLESQTGFRCPEPFRVLHRHGRGRRRAAGHLLDGVGR